MRSRFGVRMTASLFSSTSNASTNGASVKVDHMYLCLRQDSSKSLILVGSLTIHMHMMGMLSKSLA